MVGFRRERNTTSVPYRSNEMGIGFRDDVNYFNLDPITAGPQITSYLDFSNFVPSYVPPPPPPAPVYVPNADGGGGYNSGYDDIPSLTSGPNSGVDIGVGADYTTASDLGYANYNGVEMGPGGGSGSNDDHSGAGMGNTGSDNTGGSTGGSPSSGAGTDPDANDDSGMSGGRWSHGGAIPPMYANQGEIATNDPYKYSKEQRARQQAEHDAMTKAGMNAKLAREKEEMFQEKLGGYVPETVKQAYSGITNFFSNKAAPLTDLAENPTIDNLNKAIGATVTPASGVSYMLGLPPGIGPAVVEGFYDGISYLGNTYGDQAKADRALKAEINRITGGSTSNNPIAAAENKVGDYGIDDTKPDLDPNMGAIPGSYAPPSSNITTVSNPITGTPVYNSFVASTYDDFMADVAAEIAAIDSEYQDFTSSYSNYNQDDNDGGGGYDPGNAGHSPGSNANASDPNTGMGMGMEGGNDGFRSAGGKIYASQGGYVNSTGGK
jgi:hypothetical protein